MTNFVLLNEWVAEGVTCDPHDFSQERWKSELDRGDEKSNCTTFFRNLK